MILKLTEHGMFALFPECFCAGIVWLLLSNRLTHVSDTCFKVFKWLDTPTSTTQLESSVPQHQLFSVGKDMKNTFSTVLY